ncbi:MAG: hypothetical protein MUP81_00690 [Dehalococcoidia bacterium]|nr:hypothetical protein [Dehalococcoidia bacterium]
MPEKKTGDKVTPEAKVETPKVEQPKAEEVKPLSPQEELDATRKQLGELESKLTAAQEEAKAHQRNVSKKDQELQEERQRLTKIDEIGGRIELLEGFIAELGDKTVEKGEGGIGFAAKVRASQMQRQRETIGRKASEVSDEVDKLLKDTGLTKTSPELKAAGLLYSLGTQTGNLRNFDEALSEVKEAIAKLPPKAKEGEKMETEEEKVNKLVEERLKAKMIEKGLLTPEGGEPSAAGGHTFTAEQIRKMSTDEYAKLQPEINKARREGRIK